MEEIFGKFNDTLFKEKGHKYYKKDKELISVTSLIGKYQNPFNENYWALWTALKESGNTLKIWQFKPDVIDYRPFLTVTVETVKKQWALEKDIGLTCGTAVHNYLEGLWNSKVLDIQCKYDRYTILKKQAEAFYVDFKDRYTPVKMEFVISNEFLAGQMDGLFYDNLNKGYVLFDYKTDKEIKFENKYQKLLKPFDKLDDCNFNKYSIQTSLYKRIFEEETGQPIIDVKIIWFCYTNESYQIIQPNLITEEINKIWQQYQSQLVD